MTTDGRPHAGDDQSPLRQNYRGASELVVLVKRWGQRPMPAAVLCAFEELEEEYDALLDTASQFCVMRADVGEVLGLDPDVQPRQQLRTLDGTIEGALHKHTVCLRAIVGENVAVDASWLVSRDWRGPIVLGWMGFLQSIAFGCDPGVTLDDVGTFYFAPLSG